MSILTLAPEALVQEYEWTTDLVVSRNGNEQRIALRQIPRQTFKVNYLADSDEEIQYWKVTLSRDLNAQWSFPLWHEAVQITAPVTALDVTVFADFTLMDDELGDPVMLILHPDGETHEKFIPVLPRLADEAPLAAGSFANDYPLGSVVIPIEGCFIDNNSSYAAMTNKAATLSLNFVAVNYRAVDGKGAAAIPTHTPDAVLRPGAPTLPLLERRPTSTNAPSVFNENIERIDFGGKIELRTVEDDAKIVNGRQYHSDGLAERQFWKSFINTIRGQQKSFYTSTYRPDMTIVVQPAIGGTTFIVKDDALVAVFWENKDSHSELSIQTADGTTQLVTIDPALTVDNLDGTHTVAFQPALTATPLGSTVEVVSFLELVRLGTDTVSVEYGQVSRQVNLSVRTIEA